MDTISFKQHFFAVFFTICNIRHTRGGVRGPIGLQTRQGQEYTGRPLRITERIKAANRETGNEMVG